MSSSAYGEGTAGDNPALITALITDPALKAVIDGRPMLPEPIRAAVLALVKTAVNET